MIYRLKHWRWNRATFKTGSSLFSVPFDVRRNRHFVLHRLLGIFFTLWLTIRRTLPSAVAEYATFRDLPSRKKRKKKKKEPVLCEKSCDGGPLVVAQRKIFSPFKPPSTIATVNIRKHPVSMYGAELFYPDDYNALLFYSTPEMNCARCTQ